MRTNSQAQNDGEATARASTPSSQAAAYLTSFAVEYASIVATWIRSDQELTLLAPATPPPLTADKVLGWGRERRCRHLFWSADLNLPVGYAELNEMPERNDQMWIGHFLVDPAARGRGIGTRFANALVSRAFVELGVSDVMLVVFPQNAEAIRCYERAGMVVLGKERKYFETTGAEHLFLRMGIDRSRFTRLAGKGLLPIQPLAFYDVPPRLQSHLIS